ncbi:DUF1349 domain-containing protein [Paenibacillus luteus]|uniref:DUF1349 domain-containing protein n=1 Tax=Paenibacillus luteus TaxID=2545753 RepID=UPI001142A62C|nr:DUF1349 domain-containing protein [Paenibacillus luteus]
MTRVIAWNEGIWSTEPVSYRHEGTGVVVEAVKGSDYWQKTMYGFEHDNGHALLAPWKEQEAIEISFELKGFTELYDQAGIMLWQSRTSWIKAGIEINDGVPHIGAVVTDTYSDWSLSPVPEWMGELVTIRASRSQDAVILRARTQNHPWRTIRVARFFNEGIQQAGPFLCAPTRAGLKVAFTRWTGTAPDEDIHIDPPVSD